MQSIQSILSVKECKRDFTLRAENSWNYAKNRRKVAFSDSRTTLFKCKYFVFILLRYSMLHFIACQEFLTTERDNSFAHVKPINRSADDDQNRSIMMKMNKLAALLLTTTLTMASGAALAADSTSQTNNGQANAAADAGQVAPDAKENLAPNTGGTQSGTMLHQNNDGKHGISDDSLSKDEIHKNSQCKDGKCPDINEKVQTGDGINNDAKTKTDGTTQ